MSDRRHAYLTAAAIAGVSAILTLAVWPAGAAGGPDAELKYALIVSRHGVRSATWDTARLNAYSTAAWPDWGVAPGELTPHGRAAVKLMGAWYRDSFSAAGLFDASGCRDAARIYIHADTAQRTRETARAFSESLLPGCKIPVDTLPGGKDPLFGGVGKADPEMAAKAIRQRLGPAKEVLARHAPAFAALNRILTGGGTAHRDLMSLAADGGKNGATWVFRRPLPPRRRSVKYFFSNMPRECRSRLWDGDA
jgi:4-phytase/acid phosphatase